ncbi:MAG: TldD/PmbA family protein, partial [Candidatus Goldiibacteriota bacterium]
VKKALEAAGLAARLLDADKKLTGEMTAVISSSAGGTMIHEAVGHSLEADLVQKGLSQYAGKKGVKVASDIITVIDDATIPGKRGSFSFDDEGTPSQKTILIDRGVLVNYMYDRETAEKDNALPTGNGRRESYKFRPIPRMRNTMIAPGAGSAESLIKDTKRGIFVIRMGGGQVNTVTGEFVFEVKEGYMIEAGKTAYPVRGATLMGTGVEVLNSIDAVCSDIGFDAGTCGKDSQGVPVGDAQPTLRIPKILVGSK